MIEIALNIKSQGTEKLEIFSFASFSFFPFHFLMFSYHDQTLELVFHILLKRINSSSLQENIKQKTS